MNYVGMICLVGFVVHVVVGMGVVFLATTPLGEKLGIVADEPPWEK